MTYGVHAAHDISAGVGGVSLANVSKRVRVAEHSYRLLELGEVLGTDEDGGVAAVAGDDDPLVPALDPIDQLREVIADSAKRLSSRHRHDWDAPWAARPVTTGCLGSDCADPADATRTARTRMHDYRRHGTTALFAALEIATGKVTGRCRQRHRQQQFVRFLKQVARAYPEGELHLVMNNYAAHKRIENFRSTISP